MGARGEAEGWRGAVQPPKRESAGHLPQRSKLDQTKQEADAASS